MSENSNTPVRVRFAPSPTGPLHLGHTRWAAVGDALARVLAAAHRRVILRQTTLEAEAAKLQTAESRALAFELAVAVAIFLAGRWMFRRLSPHFEDFV